MDGTGPWEKFYKVWEVMELDIFQSNPSPIILSRKLVEEIYFYRQEAKKIV